jgi:hypothetical protein
MSESSKLPAAAGEGCCAELRRPDAQPSHVGIIIGSFCYQYFNYFCLLDLPSYFAERWQMQITRNGWYTGFSYLGFAIVATVSDIWQTISSAAAMIW